MPTIIHPNLPGRRKVVTDRQAAAWATAGWVVEPQKKPSRKRPADSESEVSPPEASEVPQLDVNEDLD